MAASPRRPGRPGSPVASEAASPGRDLAASAMMGANYMVATPGRMAKESASLMTCTLMRTVSVHKELCKAVLLDTTYQVRHQVLSSFRELIKSSVKKDPNVPKVLRKYAERAIDTLWTDIEDEIERDIEACLMAQLAYADVRGPTARWPFSALLACRAAFLHHYLPHDRSIWGKIKDPVYLLILFSMLLPVSVMHFSICSVLLLMLLFPGPPDEFQLLNFIMLFKGLQFISFGILKCVKASMVEYACYSIDKVNLLSCVNTFGPPSTTPLDLMLDYMGTTVLTWLAVGMLSRSKAYASYGKRQDTFAAEANKRQVGGRLRHLLHYDLACFASSIVLLVILTFALCDSVWPVELLGSPQFSANIFWCSILWSLSTFPFLPLNASWLFMAFSRTTPTGFNEQGACVPFEIAWESKDKPVSWVQGLASGVQSRVGSSLRTFRSAGTLPRSEGSLEPVGCAKAACNLPRGSLRDAIIKCTMDSAILEDRTSFPEQMLAVWDRY